MRGNANAQQAGLEVYVSQLMAAKLFWHLSDHQRVKNKKEYVAVGINETFSGGLGWTFCMEGYVLSNYTVARRIYAVCVFQVPSLSLSLTSERHSSTIRLSKPRTDRRPSCLIMWGACLLRVFINHTSFLLRLQDSFPGP